MMSQTRQRPARHANIAVFVPHSGCPHTCSFCNQRTISGQSAQPAPEQVSALLASDLERMERSGGTPDGRELAFFGGSFTAIDREYMTALLNAAQPYLGRNISGIRCSTRPDCISEDILSCLRSYGVTAVELGAQSMDDRVLELNRRGHTSAHVEQASRLIRAYGMELGLQMMTGLYGDTHEGAWYTARRLAELQPQTVRIYPTVVLEGTELGRLYKAGEYVTDTTEQAVELCAGLIEFFEQRDIRVIRVGLHASEDVERSYLAGAYHPAFRELCQARIYLRKMLAALESDSNVTGFAVHPAELSKALGQKKSNLITLREHMDDPVVTADCQVPIGEIKVIYKT